MSLKFLVQRILRRWYCVVAGLLAVAGLCYWVNGHSPVQYRIQGSVVLLPSPETVGGGNPYLFLNGLGQAMDVVTRRLIAPAVKDPIASGHPHAAYTATSDVTNGSSIILLTVTSESASDAEAVLSGLMDQIPAVLVGMQDELQVPLKGRIASMPVAAQAAPTLDSKTRLQLLAVSAVGGVAVTLLLTALIDGLILRWKARRDRRKVLSAKDSKRPKAPRFAKRRKRAPGPAPTTDAPMEVVPVEVIPDVPLVESAPEYPTEVSR